MIKIHDISKTFLGIKALDNISLTVEDKEFFGLLGPNGAGKSTLMNLLIGYFNPDSGKIIINDNEVSVSNSEFRMTIGYVPQSLALYDELNPVQNLEIFGRLYNIPPGQLKERIKEKLNAVQLYDRRKDIVKNFSGGMKRRLNLIASLLHEPQILLCDEPTVGVDPQSRSAIFDYLTKLNKEGKTIIYTTHYMEEAERLCSRIAIIDAGKIISLGTIDELIRQLPYDETIIINKNQETLSHLALFQQFGAILDDNDRMELKPNGSFILSDFFRSLEVNGIKYRDIELHKPTLEALFLQLTGRKLRD
jgi:ABC-2 type transport system ATP-binding protein